MDYWKECISIALEEEGVDATEVQIENIAGAVEGAHECYGMAHGHDAIPNPLAVENDQLKRDLKVEREKVNCKECGGRGWITINSPLCNRSSSSQCWKCRGDTRHSP